MLEASHIELVWTEVRVHLYSVDVHHIGMNLCGLLGGHVSALFARLLFDLDILAGIPEFAFISLNLVGSLPSEVVLQPTTIHIDLTSLSEPFELLERDDLALFTCLLLLLGVVLTTFQGSPVPEFGGI